MTRDGALDLNTLKNTGIYYCYNASENMPVANQGGMLVVAASGPGTAVLQMFVNNAGGNVTIHVRRFSNNAWSSWLILP